jgi:branched-chain amino acid transport system ATP-binding protein
VSAPLLLVEDLTKRFGAVTVSDGVSLELESGRLRALIGPNGAGKTSLINQISGALAPDSGRILFAGEDVTRLDLAQRAERGLVRSFQIASLFPEYTALDNVALAVQARAGSSFRFFGRAAKAADLNERAMLALRRVGLGARASRMAGALAHGERRLLEIAIAIACQPRLLLLDEPFAGLGREESLQALSLLQQLKREFTILLVEHDMDAVFALADDISVLVGGRLLASGPPELIRESAAVRAAYLGEEEAA